MLGKFAALSDGANLFVLDGIKSEVRKLGVGTVGGSPLFVSTDRMLGIRNSGTALFFYETGRVASLSEPGLALGAGSTVASLPKGGTLAVAVMAQPPMNVLYLSVVP